MSNFPSSIQDLSSLRAQLIQVCVAPSGLKGKLLAHLRSGIELLNGFKTALDTRQIDRRYGIMDAQHEVVDDSFFEMVKDLRNLLDELEKHCKELRGPSQEVGQETDQVGQELDHSVPEASVDQSVEETHVKLRGIPKRTVAETDSGYVASGEIRASAIDRLSRGSCGSRYSRLEQTVPKTIDRGDEGSRRSPCEASDDESEPSMMPSANKDVFDARL